MYKKDFLLLKIAFFSETNSPRKSMKRLIEDGGGHIFRRTETIFGGHN